MKFTGSVEMRGLLKAIASVTPAEVGASLYRRGEAVMAASKPEVPVDTGALRSSGFVEPPQRRGNVISVTLGYGGAAAEYAIPVHENLEAYHATGGAKYLERPFLEAMHGMGDAIAADLEAQIKARV